MRIEAARHDDFADLVAACAMSLKQCVDVAGPLVGAALVFGLEPR